MEFDVFQVSEKEVEAYLYKTEGIITDPKFLAEMINYFISKFFTQKTTDLDQ